MKRTADKTSISEPIEAGSLEWFRSRVPLPLLLQAVYENRDDLTEVVGESEFTRFRDMAAALTGHFEAFDDPNAKEIVARLRKLTGSAGRLRPTSGQSATVKEW